MKYREIQRQCCIVFLFLFLDLTHSKIKATLKLAYVYTDLVILPRFNALYFIHIFNK